MAGKRKDRYQVWFPGEARWELWFIDEDRQAVLANTCGDLSGLAFRAGKGRRVLAIPSRFLQCHTFYSSATDENGLAAAAKSCLEQHEWDGDLEGLGLQPVAGAPPRTLTRLDVLADASFIASLPPKLKPDLFVPAASLLPIPSQGLAIWNELGRAVAGLERNGLVLSYLSLPSSRPESMKDSLEPWIAQLIEEKKTGRPAGFHAWADLAPALLDRLPGGNRATPRPAPAGLRSCIPVRPGPVRKLEDDKNARRKRRIRIGAAALGAAAIISICQALMVFSDGIILNQRQELTQLNNDARKIEQHRRQWSEVSLAVDQDASVLEIWRSLVTLPLAGSIKVSKMALSPQGISLSCQAESSQHALGFVDHLAKNEKFSSYHWDYSTPEVRLDGTALIDVWGEKSIRRQP